ncbi:hypothetical protein GCM10008995_23070 [Halobellus salinus]|uniref:Conditioned medium-induced protein 4 n=1 Tax=Halobellus salinus TaxID=931585 RepID=A0A830ECJ0_9EURY|nr:conditioned medium-induced protein 4 [Halobellus salinus]GGJ12609.1 hypothetical protein GCM10008995_23070 [Halobellus salinus]SMP28833.1 hypothetical protein SAMN06265347_11423 [Halobellus salinus]
MDEKTADLRDLFVETTGEEAVTESQTAARGSLSAGDADDDAVDERLAAIVGEMADRDGFDSNLPESDLCRVVRAFFDPDTDAAGPATWSAAADAAVAESLSADVDADAVFRARLDLHLVAEADRDAPVPYADLRALVSEASAPDEPAAADDGALAAALPESVEPETASRCRRVVAADLASRRVNHRYRDAFADLLTDAEISTRLAADARRDGLEEATEDLETDVSL